MSYGYTKEDWKKLIKSKRWKKELKHRMWTPNQQEEDENQLSLFKQPKESK